MTHRRTMPRLAVALALLALAVRLAVPQGFMVSSQASGPSIVVCTGHGPLQLDRLGDHKAPAEKSKADPTCAFAGAIAPTLPIGSTIPRQAVAFDRIVPGAASEQTPGRGLAAPPPPAIGPPQLV